MCRLLGAVANEEAKFRLTLREAPRSLAVLSREHPDGWGIGVYSQSSGWSIQRGTLCAHEDDEFHEVAAGSRGELLVAHVRKRTVGAVSLDNTHPFQRAGWVFAHNGTIEDVEWLRAQTSAAQMREVRGETDSELLFSFFLSRFEESKVAPTGEGDAADRALAGALAQLLQRPKLGACTFLLSNGRTLYAHRWGRSLFALERVPGDAVRVERESIETGAIVETAWSPARHAVLIASEKITDEPWRSIEEGTLLRVDRLPRPRCQTIAIG
ncbi:MAG TPA: class II glutamine amidotransferase [Polyangiaceae bacterium]